MKRLAALLAIAAFAVPAAAQTSQAPRPEAGDWRPVDADNTLVIDTNIGRIIIEMAPLVAPAHVERLKVLARQGFYDGNEFFRVIEGFMAQTGDPTNQGTGDSSLPDLKPEFKFKRSAGAPLSWSAKPAGATQALIGAMPVSTQPDALMALTLDKTVEANGLFCPGVLGMARADRVDSANSQFFLMRSSRPQLDGKYTAFGRVVVGLDVVRRIKTGEPVTPPRDNMTKVRVLADIPQAERPVVEVMKTDSATFRAYADGVARQRAQSFTACDLDVPGRVRQP